MLPAPARLGGEPVRTDELGERGRPAKILVLRRPARHLHQDRREVDALLGQAIHRPAPVLGIRLRREDALVLEAREPLGGLLFALGGLLLLQLPLVPDYAGHFLPGALVTGAAVGLVLPSLTGAAVHGLPANRFGLGSGVNQAFRQIASALGVAFTLALLEATPGPAGFEHVFTLILAGGVGTALLGTRIDTRPSALVGAEHPAQPADDVVDERGVLRPPLRHVS
jgi:hypothetical protein